MALEEQRGLEDDLLQPAALFLGPLTGAKGDQTAVDVAGQCSRELQRVALASSV